MMNPRLLATCLAILLVAGAAWAANTPPPGLPGQFITNGGNNQWGVASTTSGTAAAQMRGIPTSVYGGYIAYGDVNAEGAQGATLPQQAYPNLIASHSSLGLQVNYQNNFASFDCDIANLNIFGGGSAPPYSPNTEVNPLVTWLPSVNGPTFGAGNYANGLADSSRCWLAGLTYLSIPQQYKTNAQQFSTTGSWGNFSSYGGAMGITTTQNAASATTTITTYGGPVYLSYELRAVSTGTASGGVFSYSLGGTITGTATSAGNSSWTFACGSLCPTSQAPAAIRIPATGSLPAGTYGLSLNVTSSSSANNPVTILGASTPPGKSYLSGNPTVFFGGQLFEQNNAQSAAVAAYNAQEMAIANGLFSSGLSVNFVNVQNYINATTDMANTLNPNASGQFKITQAFEGAVQMAPNVTGMVDPRAFGAECNTINGLGSLSAATVTGSPNITVNGLNLVNAPDPLGNVNQTIVLGGAPEAAPTSTILSVNSNTTATISANAENTNNGAFLQIGHNDTANFQKAMAAAQTSQLGVYVPPHCMVAGLNKQDFVTLHGQSMATQLNPYNVPGVQPILNIASNFYADDPLYGINIGGATAFGLDGFEISGVAFPQGCMPPGPLNPGGLNCTFGVGQVGSLVGTTGSTSSDGEPISLSNMTLIHAPICLGPALGLTSVGHMFGRSFNSSYQGCQIGLYGPGLSDWKSDGDDMSDWAANFYLGPAGYASFPPVSSYFTNLRSEDHPPGVLDGAQQIQFNTSQHQFNGNPAEVIIWNSGNISFTSGFFQSQTSGVGAPSVEICGSNAITFDNVTWLDASVMLDATMTGCTKSSNVSINGGNSASVNGIANWGSVGAPDNFTVDMVQWPFTHTGDSSFYVNPTTGQAGIHMATSTPTAGTALDLLNNTTTANSSLGLPKGTTGNRPTSPTAGMIRYNSSINQVESYNGTWTTLGFLNNYVGGYQILNDTTTPNTVIDIDPGIAAADNNSQMIALNGLITKTTATWSAGSGGGLVDTTSVAPSTYYNTFAIGGVGVASDILGSTSGVSPAVPAAYSAKARIGCGVKTDGSSHLLTLLQLGQDNCVWGVPTSDYNQALPASTTNVLVTLNVPVGVRVKPKCTYSISGTGGAVLMYSPDSTPAATTTTQPFAASPGYSFLASSTTGGPANAACPDVITNTSGQVGLNLALTSTSTVGIITQGWEELHQPPPAPLQFDTVINTSVGLTTTTTTAIVNISTSYANEPIVIVLKTTQAGSLAWTLTGSSLTWTNRKNINMGACFGVCMSEWYALAPTPLTSETLTISASGIGAFGNYANIQGASFTGANPSAIFDTATGIPTSNTSGSNGALKTTTTTTTANDLILTWAAGFPPSSSCNAATPPNYVSLGSTGGGTALYSAYTNASGTLLGATTTWTFSGNCSNSNAILTDAIQPLGK